MLNTIILVVSVLISGVATHFLWQGIKVQNDINHIKKSFKIITATIVDIKMVCKKNQYPYPVGYYYGEAHPICTYTIDNKKYKNVCEDITYKCDLPIKSDVVGKRDYFERYYNKQIQVVYTENNPNIIIDINSLSKPFWNEYMTKFGFAAVLSMCCIFIGIMCENINLYDLYEVYDYIGDLFIGTCIIRYLIKQIRDIKIKKYGERIVAKIIDYDKFYSDVGIENQFIPFNIPLICYEVKGKKYYTRCHEYIKKTKHIRTRNYGRVNSMADQEPLANDFLNTTIRIYCLTSQPEKYYCKIDPAATEAKITRLQVHLSILYELFKRSIYKIKYFNN